MYSWRPRHPGVIYKYLVFIAFKEKEATAFILVSFGQAPQFNMSSKLFPGDPSKVMVIRKVTPEITTFSVPFSRFGLFKIGGRGTLGNIPI